MLDVQCNLPAINFIHKLVFKKKYWGQPWLTNLTIVKKNNPGQNLFLLNNIKKLPF